MASSLLRIVVAFAVISFIFFIGTLVTNIKEERRYHLLVIQGLMFAQFLNFVFARYTWTYLYVLTWNYASKTHGGRLRKLLMTPLAFVLIMAQFSFISGYILSNVEPHWFVVLSFSCFGIMMIMVTLVFIAQILDSILALADLNRGRNRSFPTVVKCVCILILTAILAISALLNAAQPPVVKTFRIPVLHLPKCFQRLTILQLSDMHIGPTVGKTKVEFIVELSNKLKPDVVLFSGDLLDAPLQIKQAVKPLSKLESKYGVFFVAGNHDFYTGYINEWLKELRILNITVLQNRFLPLVSKNPSCKGEKIYLAGVFDKEGGLLRSPDYGQNLSKALNNREPGIPTILLAHRPSAAKTAVEQFNDIALALCGHTHGGQLFPLSLWHYIMEPYFSGLYKIEQSHSYIYVSSGVFYWGMPMRQFSEAEITLFKLEDINYNNKFENL